MPRPIIIVGKKNVQADRISRDGVVSLHMRDCGISLGSFSSLVLLRLEFPVPFSGEFDLPVRMAICPYHVYFSTA